jgi:hypothetical protein
MKRVLEVSLLAELRHCTFLELIIEEKYACLKLLQSCRTLVRGYLAAVCIFLKALSKFEYLSKRRREQV